MIGVAYSYNLKTLNPEDQLFTVVNDTNISNSKNQRQRSFSSQHTAILIIIYFIFDKIKKVNSSPKSQQAEGLQIISKLLYSQTSSFQKSQYLKIQSIEIHKKSRKTQYL